MKKIPMLFSLTSIVLYIIGFTGIIDARKRHSSILRDRAERWLSLGLIVNGIGTLLEILLLSRKDTCDIESVEPEDASD